MDYTSIEEVKEKHFKDDSKDVISSKWERHWKNAEEAKTKELCNNLLKNHIRLLKNHPESNNGLNRINIINYLKNKLDKM